MKQNSWFQIIRIFIMRGLSLWGPTSQMHCDFILGFTNVIKHNGTNSDIIKSHFWRGWINNKTTNSHPNDNICVTSQLDAGFNTTPITNDDLFPMDNIDEITDNYTNLLFGTNQTNMPCWMLGQTPRCPLSFLHRQIADQRRPNPLHTL